MAAVGKRVGIDLGTTNSAVAIMQGPAPEILLSRESKQTTRSAVSLRSRRGRGGAMSEEIIVGDAAIANWELAPKDTIVSIKRLMGRSVDDEEVQRVKEWFRYEVVAPSDGTRDSVRVLLGGKEYSPVDISARILGKLKEDAEFRLGEPVTHAVITVPAYFSQAQKADTRRAGLKAGLKVIKILDEPTAAAVAYGIDQSEDGGGPKTILVYDLGGGTFDISVLMMSGGTFLTLNTEGDMWLGGDNFDQAVVEFAVKQIKDEYGIDPSDNERFMVTLKKEAQQAKERLGAMESTEMIITGVLTDDAGIAMDVFVEITRPEYERLIRPLVQRSLKLVDKAIENANLDDDEVDFVLLAGNATMTPLVQSMLEQRFGAERVLRKKHPKHCVAEGAAVVAKLLVGTVCFACGHPNPEGVEVCENPECEVKLVLEGQECPQCGYVNEPGAEVCAGCQKVLPKIVVGSLSTRHYGVQLAGDKFAVYVKKNDELPMPEPAWQMFHTQTPNQRMIAVPVWGGDELDKASANEKQGEALALLPPMLPQGTGVRIGLQLDGDEVFQVFARLEDGRELRPWLMIGGKDQQVVEQLNALEQQMANAGPAQQNALEAAREEAFENLAEGDYDQAQEAVDGLKDILDQAGGGEDVEALDEQAARLVGFTRFILDEYKWALPTEKAYELTRLVGATETAMASNNRQALANAVAALDKATDELPDFINALLGIRGAIMSRIHPVQPAEAGQLLAELDQVIAVLKVNPARGFVALQMLMEKVVKVLEAADRGAKCPSCSAKVQAGVRYCPQCNWDLWIPTGEQQVTSKRGR